MIIAFNVAMNREYIVVSIFALSDLFGGFVLFFKQ
jgi:hypothetical protein